MQYISILFATSAALVSSQSVPEDYEWNVVNWSAGCARECSYSFNISGPLVPPYPSFTATCSGYDTGAFTNCEVIDASLSNGAFPSVLSLVAPSTGDGAHLQVSLLFTTDDGWSYNITGADDASFNQFVAPPESFDIEPTDPLVISPN